ncbi:MAG: DUF427 domain-containing protein [Betaproteobacteria bacterium]|nr:DUF427 domain-containing protein [Betaproteobacteria bacterium]
MSLLPRLRIQPTAKHVRALLGDTVVADSYRAVIVWEPRRVVPAYAVPINDVLATLEPALDTDIPAENALHLSEDATGVLDPSTSFRVHTTPGAELTIVHDSGRAEAAAFRPDDPDLLDYVILDFAAFSWLEEDDPIIAHPHDPFSRIDVRASSRHIVISHDGVVLAETRRSLLLFETMMPLVRYYLPREDVVVPLDRTPTRTWCAYKGEASYFAAHTRHGDLTDIAWSYENPLLDALPVGGHVAFFQERLDVTVDGTPLPRTRTPWS